MEANCNPQNVEFFSRHNKNNQLRIEWMAAASPKRESNIIESDFPREEERRTD